MKKILILVTLLLFILTFIGCENSSETTTKTNNDSIKIKINGKDINLTNVSKETLDINFIQVITDINTSNSPLVSGDYVQASTIGQNSVTLSSIKTIEPEEIFVLESTHNVIKVNLQYKNTEGFKFLKMSLLKPKISDNSSIGQQNMTQKTSEICPNLEDIQFRTSDALDTTAKIFSVSCSQTNIDIGIQYKYSEQGYIRFGFGDNTYLTSVFTLGSDNGYNLLLTEESSAEYKGIQTDSVNLWNQKFSKKHITSEFGDVTGTFWVKIDEYGGSQQITGSIQSILEQLPYWVEFVDFMVEFPNQNKSFTVLMPKISVMVQPNGDDWKVLIYSNFVTDEFSIEDVNLSTNLVLYDSLSIYRPSTEYPHMDYSDANGKTEFLGLNEPVLQHGTELTITRDSETFDIYDVALKIYDINGHVIDPYSDIEIIYFVPQI